MFTFPHWSAPAELTMPTKVPASVVKAPPLSPWTILFKLGNFLIGDHIRQYKWGFSPTHKKRSFSSFFLTNYKFRGYQGGIDYGNNIENTWQVPFPLPPAQTVFASKTSPFSSTFFLQALLVAIGTWCGSTLSESGLWLKKKPWRPEEFLCCDLHSHLSVPILKNINTISS